MAQPTGEREKKRPTMMKYFLGSNTAPRAGDGYGLVSKPSSVEFRPISYQPLVVPVEPRMEMSPLPGDLNSMIPQNIRRASTTTHVPRKPLRGCRAPRSSMIIDASTPIPRIPSPSPSRSLHSPSTPRPDPIEQTQWEDCEIPDELGVVREGTPEEIRNIVIESFNERKAIRASRLHQEATVIQTNIESSRARRGQDHKVVTESSANASTHSSPSSEYSRSGSSLSLSSNTTFDSERPAGSMPPPERGVSGLSTHSSSDCLQSPSFQESLKLQHSRSASPPPPSANLSPEMAQVEFQLQKSKARTIKSRKLFKLLPANRRSKSRSGTPDTISHPSLQTPTTYECTSCFNDIPSTTAVVGLPCKHNFCPSCFTQLVSTSIQSEFTFPPKCCRQEIPRYLLRKHLPLSALTLHDQKALEYAIPIAIRYYCPSPPCARWIDTRLALHTNGTLLCPHCTTKICTVCRGPSHRSNQDCSQDYGLGSTLEQAELAGWQRCYNCRTLVEQIQGCRHITCPCGGEFCYTCGSRWRTCTCTEDGQARLHEERAVRASLREAGVRREEEQMRVAIAAVENAERQLAEERAAEEARVAKEVAGMARREEERVGNVERYFEHLRQVLDAVKFQQRTAIESRHEASGEMIRQLEQCGERMVAAKEVEIRDEETRLVKEGKKTIEDLQKTHAYAMMETIARHRQHQDEMLGMDVSHRVSRNPYMMERQSEALKTAMLEALLPTQELERAELKQQQGRELRKWKLRTEKIVKRHDTKMLILKMRLEEAEKMRKVTEEGLRREWCDWKWFESLFQERSTMLKEDESRFVRLGANAPSPPPQQPREPPKPPGALPPGQAPKVEVARAVSFTRASDGGLGEYVQMRGWTGTPSFGLGMGMGMGSKRNPAMRG